MKTHPIENTFWGDLFGGITDKYGNHWLFHYKSSPKTNDL
jgi:PhnB protein